MDLKVSVALEKKSRLRVHFGHLPFSNPGSIPASQCVSSNFDAHTLILCRYLQVYYDSIHTPTTFHDIVRVHQYYFTTLLPVLLYYLTTSTTLLPYYQYYFTTLLYIPYYQYYFTTLLPAIPVLLYYLTTSTTYYQYSTSCTIDDLTMM